MGGKRFGTGAAIFGAAAISGIAIGFIGTEADAREKALTDCLERAGLEVASSQPPSSGRSANLYYDYRLDVDREGERLASLWVSASAGDAQRFIDSSRRYDDAEEQQRARFVAKGAITLLRRSPDSAEQQPITRCVDRALSVEVDD